MVKTSQVTSFRNLQSHQTKDWIMKRNIVAALVVVGTLVAGSLAWTSPAEAHPYGGGRYYGGSCYHGGWGRPYAYRYGYRAYPPPVIVPAPGFGFTTPGFGITVGPAYGYPVPYRSPGFGYYGW